MKPIEMITIHDEEGHVRPYRFRMTDDNGEKLTIQVKSIMDKKEERSLGKTSLTFTCFCPHDGIKAVYTVQFQKDSCKWYLIGWGNGR